MTQLGTHSSGELIRFIEAAGEGANIDAKGPMGWDGGEASAGLTKDILALANCRDGGVVVVGKSEPRPGTFELAGLSDSQAATFETTKVAAWVNNHCSPPVSLVCYRQEHRGRHFVVIAVSEFHDVPVLCTKQYELHTPAKGAKVLLRKGAVYVRTPNAESSPLSSAEEMRQLIGLATTKRADQMLAMFQAMMRGRPLLPEERHEDLFGPEKDEVRAALAAELGGQASLGGWTFLCHPVRHQPNRWEQLKTLKAVLEKSAVQVRRQYPPMAHGTHVREWGVCNGHSEEAFGLTRSGLFVSSRLFRENTYPFKHPWQPVFGEPDPDLGPGEWIDFKSNLLLVVEFFLFLSRFAENFEAGGELVYEVTAGPLAGRRLASADGTVNLDPTPPCRAATFRRRGVVTVEALRASWEGSCVGVLHDFFELFPGPTISTDTLSTWVERFKERKF